MAVMNAVHSDALQTWQVDKTSPVEHVAVGAGNVLEVGSLEDLRAAGKGGLDPNGEPYPVTRKALQASLMLPLLLEFCTDQMQLLSCLYMHVAACLCLLVMMC